MKSRSDGFFSEKLWDVRSHYLLRFAARELERAVDSKDYLRASRFLREVETLSRDVRAELGLDCPVSASLN